MLPLPQPSRRPRPPRSLHLMFRTPFHCPAGRQHARLGSGSHARCGGHAGVSSRPFRARTRPSAPPHATAGSALAGFRSRRRVVVLGRAQVQGPLLGQALAPPPRGQAAVAAARVTRHRHHQPSVPCAAFATDTQIFGCWRKRGALERASAAAWALPATLMASRLRCGPTVAATGAPSSSLPISRMTCGELRSDCCPRR